MADLAAAGLSATLLYFAPDLGAWPLLIAFAPWLLRLASSQFPFQRTPLDFPLSIFMITAAVAVWAAFDRGAAWAKLWVLVSAVLLFYAIAGQPAENLWIIAGVFSGLAVLAALVFLFNHDWVAEPLKVSAFNRMGEFWTRVRPRIGIDALHPNSAASFMAMFSPFCLAIVVRGWRKRRWILVTVSSVALALIGVALLMTTSRGAFLALAAVLGIWLLWAISNLVAQQVRLSSLPVFLFLFIAIAGLGVLVLMIWPGGLDGIALSFPGPPTAGTRLDLMRSAINLSGDYPLVGGGLASFPGLYSQYIRVIPFFLIPHGHNVLLNIAVEQGLVGAAAFSLAVLISIVVAVRSLVRAQTDQKFFLAAVLSALLIALLHGLVDDVLYGLQGTPILFLVPGLAIAVARPMGVAVSKRSEEPDPIDPSIRRRLKEFSGTALIVGLAAISIQGAWTANLGAVEMAKVELAEWPTGAWDDGSQVDELAGAKDLFSLALGFDPTDRTANHRMGLIRMLERDYNSAIGYLETAYTQDPEHRGIQKALGQSYAWTGQFDRAYVLLAPLPESHSEMSVYVWWWGTQGRPDLAESASQMVALLDNQKRARETSHVDF